MLKAINTLKLVRPLVASLSARSAAATNQSLLKSNFHTSAVKQGGDNQEFLVILFLTFFENIRKNSIKIAILFFKAPRYTGK